MKPKQITGAGRSKNPGEGDGAEIGEHTSHVEAAGTPFDCEVREVQGVADFRQTLEQLTPEELTELLAQMRSGEASIG